MKLSLDLTTITRKLHSNISIVLVGCLLILILAEGWIVKTSIDIVYSSRTISNLPKAKQVRINFLLYDEIAKRFAEGDSAPVTPVTARNPFTPLPVSEKELGNKAAPPIIVPKQTPTAPPVPPAATSTTPVAPPAATTTSKP